MAVSTKDGGITVPLVFILALQEYDFQIKYRKGIQNGNADALLQCMETPSEVPSAPIVILPNYSVEQMKLAQEEDPVIKQL